MTFAANLAQSASNNVTMRNKIINGAMTISQRNGTTAVVCADVASTYGVDRFSVYKANASATVTIGQSSTAPNGFVNSTIFSVTTGSAPTASNECQFRHTIEGFNIADFGFGTANPQPVTLSFWVRSSLTGTFAVAFQNSGSGLSYVTTYTISAANTWEQKSVTFTGPTTGTWLTNNGSGIVCIWDLGGGSDFNATPNTWTAGNVYTTSGTTKVIGTTGATFFITGVQLEEGTAASPFENRLYGTELNLCQRYFQRVDTNGGNQRIVFGVAYSSTEQYFLWSFQQKMRASPTVSVPNLGNVLKEGVAWYTPTSAFIIATAPDFANIGSVLSSSVFSLGDFSWWGRNTGDLTLTASAEL
jgi:hypothetical protein